MVTMSCDLEYSREANRGETWKEEEDRLEDCGKYNKPSSRRMMSLKTETRLGKEKAKQLSNKLMILLVLNSCAVRKEITQIIHGAKSGHFLLEFFALLIFVPLLTARFTAFEIPAIS